MKLVLLLLACLPAQGAEIKVPCEEMNGVAKAVEAVSESGVELVSPDHGLCSVRYVLKPGAKLKLPDTPSKKKARARAALMKSMAALEAKLDARTITEDERNALLRFASKLAKLGSVN